MPHGTVLTYATQALTDAGYSVEKMQLGLSRSDARFFGVAAPAELEARPDGLEIDRAWWAAPSAVLDEHALGETLMWPTFNTLKELAGCSSVPEVLSMRMEQVPPPVAGQ